MAHTNKYSVYYCYLYFFASSFVSIGSHTRGGTSIDVVMVSMTATYAMICRLYGRRIMSTTLKQDKHITVGLSYGLKLTGDYIGLNVLLLFHHLW